VVPAFNEQGSIESALSELISTFHLLGIDWEIIVVDDGSVDQTVEFAKQFSRNPGFKLVQHKTNQGIGAAFRSGVMAASNDFVILVPVDNPLSVDDLMTYIPPMKNCDIVVGVRTERVGYKWYTRWMSWVYNRILIPNLFNIGISDVNWIQAYRREIFHSGLIQIECNGVFFLVEMLVKAKRNRLIVAEVPANMTKRLHGKGTVTKISAICRTFFDMIRFFVKTI